MPDQVDLVKQLRQPTSPVPAGGERVSTVPVTAPTFNV